MSIAGLQIPLWAGVLVIAFGGLFVVLGLLTMRSARRRRRAWTALTGQVVGSRSTGDGHLRLQVEYRDQTGQAVRFWNRFSVSGGTDRAGQQVDILVNPADPTDAVISGGASGGRLVGPVFLAFGAVAVVVGIVSVVSAQG